MAKIRTGFVSNSSSSSFIIAAPRGASTKVRVVFEIDIDGLTDYRITSVEDLDKYFINQYGEYEEDGIDEIFAESPYVKQLYEKAYMAIRKNKMVYVGTASNETGDPEEDYVGTHGFGKILDEGFEIIQDAGDF